MPLIRADRLELTHAVRVVEPGERVGRERAVRRLDHAVLNRDPTLEIARLDEP